MAMPQRDDLPTPRLLTTRCALRRTRRRTVTIEASADALVQLYKLADADDSASVQNIPEGGSDLFPIIF